MSWVNYKNSGISIAVVVAGYFLYKLCAPASDQASFYAVQQIKNKLTAGLDGVDLVNEVMKNVQLLTESQLKAMKKEFRQLRRSSLEEPKEYCKIVMTWMPEIASVLESCMAQITDALGIPSQQFNSAVMQMGITPEQFRKPGNQVLSKDDLLNAINIQQKAIKKNMASVMKIVVEYAQDLEMEQKFMLMMVPNFYCLDQLYINTNIQEEDYQPSLLQMVPTDPEVKQAFKQLSLELQKWMGYYKQKIGLSERKQAEEEGLKMVMEEAGLEEQEEEQWLEEQDEGGYAGMYQQ